MNENIYLTQTQLAERWQVAESTLERWRSEGIGPIYLKLMGSVRYRLSDITGFEEDALRGSTSERASVRNDRR
ncbi:MAG: DNA-binding protein [Burkholderiales bacterium]|nr:DNA-binding protein [Burkholderiales bacterium]